MANVLDLITAKLDRADEHIETLKAMFSAYFDEDVDGSRVRFETDHGSDEGRLIFNNVARVSELTKQAVLIGEVVHNARSALDHLAWELVKANGGTPVKGGSGTHFPILKVPPTPNRHGTSKPPHIAGGIDPAAAQIIANVQPYNTPSGDTNEDLLMLLENLWNEDKHRALVVSPLHFSKESTELDITEVIHPDRPVHGCMRVVRKENSFTELEFVPDNPPVGVECKLLFYVAMPRDVTEYDRPVPVIEGLQAILKRVREDVVGPLSAFLPSHDAPPPPNPRTA